MDKSALSITTRVSTSDDALVQMHINIIKDIPSIFKPYQVTR